ncbi:putative disease resistance protein RGA4 [Ricinus communis]|uniref:putative disease resistance protein RGA4 n=1 Tax=Ricinus communis TaxID=3988 RepID=UPI00201B22D5|nr:putative disease resistance protein RGA4 [Ricinus communis]
MAEALVAASLNQPADVMEQQVKLVMGVEEEAEKLGSNLQSIQGVLVEAERRQFENHAIRHWLDNLKEVSYSIDDVLDAWNIEILKEQIEEGQESVCSWFKTQFLQLPTLKQRYKIAREIKKLNQRLHDIAKERKRYDFDLTYRGNEQIKPLVVNSAIDAAEVVSIVGLGGLGKTTLAKLAYNDSEVEKNFESRIWVSISKPFDEIKIAKAILEILINSASVLVEFEAIMQHIRKLLKGKGFLLILDDVWKMVLASGSK